VIGDFRSAAAVGGRVREDYMGRVGERRYKRIDAVRGWGRADEVMLAATFEGVRREVVRRRKLARPEVCAMGTIVGHSVLIRA